MPTIPSDPHPITLNPGKPSEITADPGEINVPDLWHIIQAMKQGTTISKKEGQRIVAAIEETWHLAHAFRRYLIDHPAE